METTLILGRANRAFVEEFDNEIVIYRPPAHKAVYLNETAALIFKLCDGTRTLGDIVTLLSAEYPEAGPDIAVDVEEAAQGLIAEGVLAKVEAGFGAAGEGKGVGG